MALSFAEHGIQSTLTRLGRQKHVLSIWEYLWLCISEGFQPSLSTKYRSPYKSSLLQNQGEMQNVRKLWQQEWVLQTEGLSEVETTSQGPGSRYPASM